MPAGLGLISHNVESLHVSGLLLKWKEITKTLVAYGHTAELYRELDHGTGQGVVANDHASESTHGHHEEPSHEPTVSHRSQIVANSAEIDRSSNDFVNISEDAWASDLDENAGDNNIYNEFVVPVHLVNEAADLSSIDVLLRR